MWRKITKTMAGNSVQIPKYLVGLDGLIGGGKSTVTELIRQERSDVYVIDEPVKEFCTYTTVSHRTISPLSMFYENDIDALPT